MTPPNETWAESARKIIDLYAELPDEVRNHPIEKEFRASVWTLCNRLMEAETGMQQFIAPPLF